MATSTEVLILEGVFALSAGRADPAVAEHGLAAALAVVASARPPASG